MTLHEHPLITDYVRRFDIAAGRVAEPRRSALREEIRAHLDEAIPEGASDADVTAIITEFGSPEEIVAQEGVDPVSRSWRPTIIAAGVLVAGALVVGVVAAVVSAVNYEEPYRTPVIAHPAGKTMTEQGRRYDEYKAAIERMEHPLPPGAVYPVGVPFSELGLDENGETVETVGGGSIAQYTWLCAWESEYLHALDDGNRDRQAAAEEMILSWSKSNFYLSLNDPDVRFLTDVIAPMQVGDSAGVQADLITSCGIAGLRPRR